MSGPLDLARLDQLIRPASIAIIGASERTTEMPGYSLANLAKHGYPGRIYPVNPRHEYVQGYRCYPDVASLPEAPDTALVLVPAARVLDVLRQCHDRGIGTATVLSSGFGEGEGDEPAAARARELSAFVAETGMRVLGPNCIGVMNLPDRAIARAAAFLPEQLIPGDVTLISQSGGASLITMNRAQSRGLGLNLVLPTGNEIDIDMSELFAYAVEQPDTSVIGLFVESIKDGHRFLQVAQRARERGIHVVAAKVGESDTGAASVAAHTGALAGSDAAYDAAFRRAGIWRVPGYDGLHEAAAILSRHGPLAGRRLGVVCISGAEAASIADDCARLGLELPPPSATTRAHMTDKLKYGRVQNPLDLTGQLFSGDRTLAADALTAVTTDPAYDAILVSITTLGREVASWLGPLLQQAQDASGKPVLVSWWTAGPRTWDAHAHLRSLGLTVFETTYRALETLAAITAPAEGTPPAPHRPGSTVGVRTGAEAAALLGPAVSFVESAVVESEAAAIAAWEKYGAPVVVKAAAEGLAHKTELGGVEVDLRTPEEVAAAFRRLARIAPSVEVQPMLKGLEVLLGVRRDATFGWTVTVGLGGVWTELFGDAATELCPVDEDTARAMVARLRAARLFAGYRGGPAYDVDALARTVAALSRWAVDQPDVRAAELNPLIVRPGTGGAVAVDALVEFSVPASR